MDWEQKTELKVQVLTLVVGLIVFYLIYFFTIR